MTKTILYIITTIFCLIFLPFVIFWFGWLDGWIAALVVGDPLCRALNVLTHTDYFTPDKLPWITGAIGYIASFFKTSNLSSTFSKNK